MSRGHRTPWPWDVLVGGYGLMLAVDQQGQLAYREEVSEPGGPEGRGMQHRVLDDWSGGVGLRHVPHAGAQDQTADRMLYVMQAVAGTGGDAVGGGLDPRFGGLMLGPRIRDPITVLGGAAITRLVEYTPLGGSTIWVAAVGPKVYKSTTVDWSSGVGDITPDATVFAAEVLDLAVAHPRKGPPELRLAFRDQSMYVNTAAVPTASTWVPDGGTDNRRKDGPLAVYRWDNAAGTFADGTSVTTDGNGATALDISSLPTTDYLLIGYKHRFEEMTVNLGSTNTNAAAMRVYYRTVSGWTAVSVLSDLTQSPAGTSLGKTGEVGWALPGAGWVPTVLSTTLQSEELYFIKIDFSAALDASVTIVELNVQYRLQVDAIGVVGAQEVFSAHGNTFLTTEFGGIDGAVGDTSEKYATRSGDVIGAVAWQGTVYFRKTDGLYTVDAQGKAVDVLPELHAQPASSRTGQGLAVWDGDLWVASDYTLRRLKPDGEVDVIGPERLTLGDSGVKVRATALCGDRDYFLMAAFLGDDGKARLGAYRTYRLVQNQLTGVEEWVPQDAWSIGLADLGNRTITSMAVFTASGQPWLVMGASDGTILTSKLAVGFGPPPEFTDLDGEAILPSYDGLDAGRKVVVPRAVVRGRNLDANKYVKLYTKAPTQSAASWALQTTFIAEGTQAFQTTYSGYGFDLKVRMGTDDHAVSPRLDALVPRYRQQLDAANRRLVLTVQAHEAVRDRRGAKVRRTADDWATLLRATLVGTAVPLAVVTPLGRTYAVMPDALVETLARPRVGDQAAPAYELALSEAD